MKFLVGLLLSLNLFANIEPIIDPSINQINEILNQYDSQKASLCPGFQIVKSCGNWKCEEELGENLNTCPSDCIKAPVRSYNQITLCKDVQKIFRPHNYDEVKAAILYAQENNLRVRVIGQMHSATDILCNSGVVITTENLNKIYGIEKFEGVETVRTDAGVIIYDLADWLHEKNKSLGFPLMGFRGVSMAGASATGSHGSSPKHTAIISNTIASMKVMDFEGKITEYSEKTTETNKWKALKASLGMLGVILEMRFKIQPQFNLDVAITYHEDTKLLEDKGIIEIVKECDYGQLNWFPGVGKFVKTCGVKTSQAADPGATNSLLDPMVPNFFVKPVKQILQLGACNKGVACLMEKARWAMMKSQPPLLKLNDKGKLKPAHRVVGPSHRMISSRLTEHQNGFFQMDWEIVVPASQAQTALYRIYDHLKKNKVCLPLVGVFIRYAPAEDQTLIAHTVAQGEFAKNEPAVFMEIPVYLPTAFSKEKMDEYEKPYVEFAKFLIEEFHGRPHWGKNRQWSFDLQKQLNGYGDNMTKFKEIVSELDPYGTFANKFGAAMGLEWNNTDPSDDPVTHPCSKNPQPVCGKDEVEYLNSCYAHYHGLSTKDFIKGSCSNYKFKQSGKLKIVNKNNGFFKIFPYKIWKI